MSQVKDLFDILTLAYDYFGRRPVLIVQEIELQLCLRNDESYEHAMQQIYDEVLYLRKSLPNLATYPSPKSFAVPAEQRAAIMYEAVVDLCHYRLLSRKRHRNDLELNLIAPAERVKDLAHLVNTLCVDHESQPKAQLEHLRKTWDGSNHSVAVKGITTKMIQTLNEEYFLRAQAAIARLGVTAEAFLARSSNKQSLLTKYHQGISEASTLMTEPIITYIRLQNIFPDEVFEPVDVHGTEVTSVVKRVLIPNVPDRGGVPEGFSQRNVDLDVLKANASMKGLKVVTKADGRVWIGGGSGSDQPSGGGGHGGIGGRERHYRRVDVASNPPSHGPPLRARGPAGPPVGARKPSGGPGGPAGPGRRGNRRPPKDGDRQEASAKAVRMDLTRPPQRAGLQEGRW